MLSLFTGLPGAAKTLNLIKYVYEDKRFQGRNIYYYGIEELASTKDIDLSGWKELTEDQVHKWYEMDDSPVILIDEAQKIWRKRGTKAEIPYDIQQLETHRHLGVDILMTCQNPMQIDHEVRALIQQHWHYERPANLKSGRKREYEICVNDPTDTWKNEPVQTLRYKIDKKYFGCYKSAETHTHGARIPVKLYIVVGLIGVCLFFMFYAYKTVVHDRAERGKQPAIDDSLINSKFATGSSVDSYLNKFVARYKDIPFSKPFYDELVTARSYPFISGCQNFKINNIDSCSCTSLQGARIEIPTNYCLAFLKNGQHDFTMPDSEVISSYNQHLPTGDPCCGSTGQTSDDNNKDE